MTEQTFGEVIDCVAVFFFSSPSSPIIISDTLGLKRHVEFSKDLKALIRFEAAFVSLDLKFLTCPERMPNINS